MLAKSAVSCANSQEKFSYRARKLAELYRETTGSAGKASGTRQMYRQSWQRQRHTLRLKATNYARN